MRDAVIPNAKKHWEDARFFFEKMAWAMPGLDVQYRKKWDPLPSAICFEGVSKRLLELIVPCDRFLMTFISSHKKL